MDECATAYDYGWNSYSGNGVNPFCPETDGERYDDFESGYCAARDYFESVYD